VRPRKEPFLPRGDLFPRPFRTIRAILLLFFIGIFLFAAVMKNEVRSITVYGGALAIMNNRAPEPVSAH
jgi:hypothetical protein